jgi:hypothetical protein
MLSRRPDSCDAGGRYIAHGAASKPVRIFLSTVSDGAEEPVGHRQIEQAIGSGCGGLLDRGQMLAQPPITVGVGEITLQIARRSGLSQDCELRNYRRQQRLCGDR